MGHHCKSIIINAYLTLSLTLMLILIPGKLFSYLFAMVDYCSDGLLPIMSDALSCVCFQPVIGSLVSSTSCVSTAVLLSTSYQCY